MDISTGLGLLAGAGVLATLILLGGDMRMFADMHSAKPV
jgi:chemotaxis protein MotA